MATKKCANGHQYDSSIYGDKCPFCPSSTSSTGKTKVPEEPIGGGTKVIDGPGTDIPGGTIKIEDPIGKNVPGGNTIIHHTNPTGGTGMVSGNRKLVGLLVSYNLNPLGDVYKIYEGKNLIGKSPTCDIALIGDNYISSSHLLVLYREAENIFWAIDQNSSNGTYINGEFASERMRLNTNDVIVIGATKLIFLAIPQY